MPLSAGGPGTGPPPKTSRRRCSSRRCARSDGSNGAAYRLPPGCFESPRTRLPITGAIARATRTIRPRTCRTLASSSRSSGGLRCIDMWISCRICSARSSACASSTRRAFARSPRCSSGRRAPSSSFSSARWRTCAEAWVAMAEHALADRVNAIVDRIVAREDASAALRDPEVAPFARIAVELRHYPAPDFKARLRATLQRRTTMTSTMTTEAVREGFTTVTPYIRVANEGLVAFLASAFGAVETFAGRGGGGGMHREVRIGSSMVMISEGSDASGMMPVTPMAFHIFVDDVDAAFARAIAAGGKAMGAPEDRHYGERAGFVTDPFGNYWFIASPLGPNSLANA